MRLACETVVNNILPAVRSLIAKELHEKGYSQTEIADLLDVTQPAVSQYLSAARGKKVQRIEADESLYQAVTEMVELLVTDADESRVSSMFCQLCRDISDRGAFDNPEQAPHVCMDH